MPEEKTRLSCYRDRTYCASPNCKNECGRKMSKEVEKLLKQDKHGRTSYAYFCDEPCKHEWVNGSFLVTHCNKCGVSKND